MPSGRVTAAMPAAKMTRGYPASSINDYHRHRRAMAESPKILRSVIILDVPRKKARELRWLDVVQVHDSILRDADDFFAHKN